VQTTRDQTPNTPPTLKMKITFRSLHLRDRGAYREEVEGLLRALAPLTLVYEASVVLEKLRQTQPLFRAEVTLAVPGPDIHAVAYDHSVSAALHKVDQHLRQQVLLRQRGDRNAPWSKPRVPRAVGWAVC
jgi:hypothetical protein